MDRKGGKGGEKKEVSPGALATNVRAPQIRFDIMRIDGRRWVRMIITCLQGCLVTRIQDGSDWKSLCNVLLSYQQYRPVVRARPLSKNSGQVFTVLPSMLSLHLKYGILRKHFNPNTIHGDFFSPPPLSTLFGKAPHYHNFGSPIPIFPHNPTFLPTSTPSTNISSTVKLPRIGSTRNTQRRRCRTARASISTVRPDAEFTCVGHGSCGRC